MRADAGPGRPGTTCADPDRPAATDGERRGDGFPPRAGIPPAESLFVAKAAHELRGAIGGIELLASMLADRVGQVSDDDELAALLRRLARQSARVQSMAAQLLDLTRFSDARAPLDRTPIDVGGLLAEVVAAERLGDAHVVLIDVADDLTIETDRLALEQIMGNLVRNALAHGGTTIGLDGHVDDEHLVLRVEDDGPGVADEVRDQLFEPFVRDGAGPQEGYGLGLAIVAELAAALRGRVVYEPNEPHGARFSVILPLR